MKNNVVTKSMARRNIRPAATALDPFRARPACQATFSPRSRALPMPPSSQLRYPVAFAAMLCFLALGFLNFAMMA
ncbi:TPA: hypothetical protein R4057_002010 [Kluyvera ascorbata]|uniref:hypothetical protein n=1 Tax=Kluyvera ascorbata TaxID=51288 RepID=UPI0028986A36|nr:hypothetical protein [Kluyvera ascorbata]HED3065057.1 hypothetical protein [Kluyvera ascorbata]